MIRPVSSTRVSRETYAARSTSTKEKKLTSPPSRRSFAKRSPSTVPASRPARRKRSPNGMTEFISIRGARENNLKDVTLQIPKRKLTIFTGVSGSGKSSIVFDTLATEAQRQLYENFSLFIRNFLPKYPQPDADAIENLTMAVIVD